MSDHKTLAAKYGAFKPLDWADDALQELELCNRLWNRLVAIGRKADSVRELVECQDAGVFDARAALAIASAEVHSALKDLKAARAETRSKMDDPAHKARLAKARAAEQAALGELLPRLKAIRRAFKADLASVEKERQGLAKIARQTSGLWWGNSNNIVVRYETSRQQAIKDGGTVRFRKFDGTGQFYAQVQGGLSVDQLLGHGAGGSRVVSVVDDLDDPRKRLVRMWIRSIERPGKRPEARFLTVPIRWDRDLPANATIMGVTATRRISGPHEEWSVVFTLRVPAPEIVTLDQPRAIAVHTGWRGHDDDIRVATTFDGQSVDEVTLRSLERQYGNPKDSILNRIARLEAAISDADTVANEIWRTVRGWVLPDAPADISDLLVAIRRTPFRNTDQLIALADLWRVRPAYRPDLGAVLREWVIDAKRHKTAMPATARRIATHRTELYRRFVADLLRRYDLVIVDSVPIKQLTTRPAEDDVVQTIGRRQRQAAAPGELRSWLVQRAGTVGRHVVQVPSNEPISAECHKCAGRVRVEKHRAVCANGHTADSDDNAVRNLYAAGLRSLDISPITPAGSAKLGRWQRAKAMKAAQETA